MFRKIGNGLGLVIKLFLSVAFVSVLFVIFMFATTGDINISKFISEINNDYRDLNLNRPPKETEFTRTMATIDNKYKSTSNGKSTKILTNEQYAGILKNYAKNMNEDLISLPEKKHNEYNKTIYKVNINDEKKLNSDKKIIQKSLQEITVDFNNYQKQVKGKTIPTKYIEIDKLIVKSNNNFKSGLTSMISGLDSKSELLVYKGMDEVYKGKDNMNKINDLLK